jgi:putative drug exporter of the RND superfamily
LAGLARFVVARRWWVLAVWVLLAVDGGGGGGVLAETLFGAAGALVVLVLVFGSFLALMPLAIAAASVLTTFLLVLALTSVTSVSFIVQYLLALIGLGVAIDYSLLVVTRWREERGRGLSSEQAVERALVTAGRSVLFSGVTVAVSLAALIALPVPFLRSVGFTGLLIPLVSVTAALTLLPALLVVAGPRLAWPRRRKADPVSRLWQSIGRFAVAHRWLSAVVATAILLALAAPVLGLRLGQAANASLASTGGTAGQAITRLDNSGIGAGLSQPVEILTRQPAQVDAAIARADGVAAAIAPAAWSVVLPLKALVLNVLSIGAAYGITVLIWQHGLGTRELFSQSASGAITVWVPIAVFAFLFGLSMDYEVFLLSRIREEHDDGHGTDDATVRGIARTGRLVTSAALILFLAFIALSRVPDTDVKILATALALGIIIDATIVRGVLAPALVAALGDVNWWWPRRVRVRSRRSG